MESNNECRCKSLGIRAQWNDGEARELQYITRKQEWIFNSEAAQTCCGDIHLPAFTLLRHRPLMDFDSDVGGVFSERPRWMLDPWVLTRLSLVPEYHRNVHQVTNPRGCVRPRK